MKHIVYIFILLYQLSATTFAQSKSTSHDGVKKIDFKKIKAVIVLGPVDKKYDADKKADRLRVAAYLKEKGVKVSEFYPPNDDWEQIKKACLGAHIFIYSGHGSYEGINYPSGGLCLTKTIYGAAKIMSDLQLHKNALIIFNSACNSAGSSAFDYDGITKKEAVKRVEEYAYPFYKLKAGAYYANNYDNSVLPFLKAFFLKENAKSIYMRQASVWQKVETFSRYSYDPLYITSVAGEAVSTVNKIPKFKSESVIKSQNKKEVRKDYNAAFVGKSDFAINDFFN